MPEAVPPPAVGSPVADHYQRPDLLDRFVAALRSAGKEPGALTVDDLAPADHFHTRGRDATLDLARLAGLAPDTSVLDVGGGIGGPARLLARDFHCRVTVLDLTPAFCELGQALTRWTGLADRVTFRQGNALDLPFPDGSFDVAWTQHSTMNIPDKPRLYREAARVLRPGGRLAFHEILAGPGGPIHVPVPWASDPAISHLASPDETRRLLAAAGLAVVQWADVTAVTTEWVRGRAAAPPPAPSPLGLHLLLGPDIRPMMANLLRNLEDHRIAVVMGRADRPA